MLIGKCLLTLWRTLVPPSEKTKMDVQEMYYRG